MSKLRYSEMFYSVQGEGRFVGVPSIFLRLFGCNFECRGFGQTSRDQSKWLPEDKMPHNQDYPDIKHLVDLPVPEIGCDSSFSWGKKWGHLAHYEDIDTIVKSFNEYQPEVSTDSPHLVITGGEPLLKGFQKPLMDLIFHPKFPTQFITFETNGTQECSFNEHISESTHDRYIDFYRRYGDRGFARWGGITWSVSPKLSLSGEKKEEALRPEALLSYNRWPHSYLYLKFVVRDEEDFKEAEEFINEYEEAGVIIDNVYMMPEGATSDGQSYTEGTVAQLCLKYGYSFSPRLHINLFGNKWVT